MTTTTRGRYAAPRTRNPFYLLATLAAGLLLLIGACSTSEPVDAADATQPSPVPANVESVPQTTEPKPEPEPTKTPEPTPAERSQRGTLVKDIGETAGMFWDPNDRDGTTWLEFQVTDIRAGECTGEFAEPSENGQFLFVDLSVSTSSNWPPDAEGIGISFDSFDFSIVGEDGLTESNLDTFAAYSCLPDGELLPMSIGPGEKVIGTVVLDTANPHGVLVFRPWFGGGTGGWEWEY